MSKTFIPHASTSLNITVYLPGKAPVVVPQNTAQAELLKKAIEAGDLDAVEDALNVRQAVAKQSFGLITVDNDTLMFENEPLHNSLVTRILTVIRDAGNAGPLLAFLNNLMQNPSHRAVNETFDFLEHNDLPITDDGCFLAYKKVRHDFKDIYTGTMDNSPGQTPWMRRNLVNEDKNKTCESGLHFCSKSYLPHYGSSGSRSTDRIVVVKINPADVVSIPVDYNQAKGRACRYYVVEEITSDGIDVVTELKSDYKDTKKAGPAALTDSPQDVPAKKATTAPGKNSLTITQVRDIRSMLDDEWPLAQIAKVVGTSARTVARIRDGETYTDVN